MPAAAAQSIAPGKSLELAGEELHRIKALRSWPKTNPDDPKRLYEIYDPPLILYVRGSYEIINK